MFIINFDMPEFIVTILFDPLYLPHILKFSLLFGLHTATRYFILGLTFVFTQFHLRERKIQVKLEVNFSRNMYF